MATAHIEEQRRADRLRRWAVRNWVSLALVLVALVYGGAITIVHDDSASPIDEVVYLDYAYKVWSQGMVHDGETFGDDVAHLVACENVVPFGPLGQECGSDDVILENMPNEGYTTGAAYTPLYFLTVRIIGDPIHAITGISEVTSWRLSGILWLAGTMVLLSALLRRSGVSDLATFTLGLIFIGSPYAWWTYTYLSTDVSVVLFGAAILLVTMEAVRGRVSAWWLVPLGLLAPIFKITNLLVFGLVLLYLVINAVARRLAVRRGALTVEAPTKPWTAVWLPLGIAVVLAGAVQAVWMRLVPLLAVSDVVVDQGVNSPLTRSEIVRLATNGMTGAITHNPFGGFSGTPWSGLVFTPLSWLMIAAVVGAVMSIRWDDERGPVIWATAIASVTALPALGILMWVLAHSYFQLPGRYGAALIPAILLLAGYMLRNRAAIVIFLGYAAILMTFGVTLAVHIGTAY